MPYVVDTDSADGGNGVASNMDTFIRTKLLTFITSTSLFATNSNWTRSQGDNNVGTDEEEFWLTPPSALTLGVDSPSYISGHTKADGVFLFMNQGFDGSNPPYDQPSGPGLGPRATSNNPVFDSGETDPNPTHFCPYILGLPAGPYISHKLLAPADGSYCYAAIQVATRQWRHLWFGTMTKFGSFVGGEFLAGHVVSSNANAIDNPYQSSTNFNPGCGYAAGSLSPALGTIFRADGLNGALEWWFTENANVTTTSQTFTRPSTGGGTYSNNNNSGGAQTLGHGYCSGPGSAALGTALFNLSPSIISGAKPLIPIYIAITDLISGVNKICPIGEFPDVFRFNMAGFTPGDTITLGSFDYLLIPVLNSDTVSTLAGEEYSGYEGYAYRIVDP